VPSLVSHASGPSKREDELVAELEAEKKRYEEACKEKKALEAEIESLSQALFEEVSPYL
jgi:cell division protein FtsB